jgi:hypothetical protein
MKNPPSLGKNDWNRREFLRLGLLASAALANGRLTFAAEETHPGVTYYGALQPLAPGAVRPEGWLRTWLEKQAAQLGSKLPQVSWPFSAAYWAGEETATSWWPWEQKAYWLDGATRLALVLEDKDLMAQVRTTLDYTLAHAEATGYLGPKFFEDPVGDFHRWPQNVLFRSLAALSDATAVPGNPESADIPAALRKHFLGDNADYGKPVRNITNVEGMLWTYARTGDPALLALAENAWSEFLKNENPGYADMAELRVFAATPIDCHGVTYAEIMKLPGLLYLYTGNPEYLRFAAAAERRIFDHHMLIDGIPSTTEAYRTVTSLDSHETCDISDHTWSWGYMLMARGRAVWADRVERACFNAAPGAIKKDWKALQYFSCPNQFLATLDSDHNVMEHGGRKMAYQPNPGQNTACCGGNVHRIFPNYTIRMWMKTADGGLAAVLYGPSTLSARVGDGGSTVRIAQTTDYPFRERIEFRIDADGPVAFPLALRVPGWCSAPRLEINGRPVPILRNENGFGENGFFVLRRTFTPGERIALTLPMKLAVTHWPQNGLGIERGPIVYSLPIKENWTSRVEPTYTTEDFPSWEATPASNWNYGLALDPERLESEVHVRNNPGLIEDPWENPPTTLSVPVRKIEGWELQLNPDQPEQKFTPPLPDLSMNRPAGEVERVALVPYGSTQLRLTVFPTVPR